MVKARSPLSTKALLLVDTCMSGPGWGGGLGFRV